MGAARVRQADPRIERSRTVIMRAALVELATAGYGAFSIESVAARAGVGKSTIYRHWREKITLIADACETLRSQLSPDVSRGSPRERLRSIVRYVAQLVADSPFASCLPALIDGAARDRELRAFLLRFQAQARRPLLDAIADGVCDGELPRHVDVELATFALLGAIVFQRLMTATPFDPERTDVLIDSVLGPRKQKQRRRR